MNSPTEFRDRVAEGWRPSFVDLRGAPSTEERYDFGLLMKMPQLEDFWIRDTTLQVSDLEQFPSFAKLKSLGFFRCRFEPGAIAALPELKSLKTLSFQLSEITDEEFGIAADKYGSSVETLSLFYTHLTDDAAEHLAKFPKLQDVDIRGTMTTNRPFEYLRGLRDLRSVDVDMRGPITLFDVDMLKRAKPGLTVRRSI